MAKASNFFKEAKAENPNLTLKMVHINKARCDQYYWNWSSNHKDWIRGDELPERLKVAYKNPHTRSNYK